MADLIIKQGADFFHRFIIKSSLGDTVDLTGYTGAAQFRDAPGGTLYGAFTVATGGANGFLDLSMEDAVTDTLTPGSYVYDVFITNAATDDVQNVTSGAVRVLQRITV